MVILDSGLDQRANDFGERECPRESGTAGFGNDFCIPVFYSWVEPRPVVRIAGTEDCESRTHRFCGLFIVATFRLFRRCEPNESHSS